MKHSDRLAYLLITQGTEEADVLRNFFRGRTVGSAVLTSPYHTLSKAIQTLAARGAREICLLPFIRRYNRKLKQDIPDEIQSAKRLFPAVDFHYAGVFFSNMIHGLKAQRGILHG